MFDLDKYALLLLAERRKADTSAANEHKNIRCPKCGLIQSATHKKCSRCGHDLADARKAKFAKTSGNHALEPGADLILAASSMAKASTPEPVGPGPLWKHPGWKLPAFIEHVANDLRTDHTESEAVEMAVGIVHNWADGHPSGGEKDVHPDTVAAARKAIAEWEALRAKAHALAAAKVKPSDHKAAA